MFKAILLGTAGMFFSATLIEWAGVNGCLLYTSDVMMPVMDGLTATKTIRSLERQDAKTIPIIAMTANAFREDAEKLSLIHI